MLTRTLRKRIFVSKQQMDWQAFTKKLCFGKAARRAFSFRLIFVRREAEEFPLNIA